MPELSFRDAAELLHYLTTTKAGKAILSEASTERWLVEEVLHFNKPTYVLVKAFRDGLIEVYGPRHVRAEIVLLGRSVTFPEHEIARDQLLDSRLPEMYRQLHYPKYRRESALRGVDPCHRVSS